MLFLSFYNWQGVKKSCHNVLVNNKFMEKVRFWWGPYMKRFNCYYDFEYTILKILTFPG